MKKYMFIFAYVFYVFTLCALVRCNITNTKDDSDIYISTNGYDAITGRINNNLPDSIVSQIYHIKMEFDCWQWVDLNVTSCDSICLISISPEADVVLSVDTILFQSKNEEPINFNSFITMDWSTNLPQDSLTKIGIGMTYSIQSDKPNFRIAMVDRNKFLEFSYSEAKTGIASMSINKKVYLCNEKIRIKIRLTK
jgi:hypothetical protein